MKKVNEDQLARIQWQCRRGTLELDCLLGAILQKHYENLSPAEKNTLEKLLACTDEQLTEWLILGVLPIDQEIAALVEKF